MPDMSEHLFLETIDGVGFRNDKNDTYIEISPTEWLKIDPATLRIYFKDKEREEDGRDDRK